MPTERRCRVCLSQSRNWLVLFRLLTSNAAKVNAEEKTTVIERDREGRRVTEC